MRYFLSAGRETRRDVELVNRYRRRRSFISSCIAAAEGALDLRDFFCHHGPNTPADGRVLLLACRDEVPEFCAHGGGSPTTPNRCWKWRQMVTAPLSMPIGGASYVWRRAVLSTGKRANIFMGLRTDALRTLTKGGVTIAL